MTAFAAELNASVAIGALTLLANQRTDALGLAADGIKRIQTCQLDVQFGLSILVEQLESGFRGIVPAAVDIARIAPNALEVSLQQPRNVGLIHLGSSRRGGISRGARGRRQRGDLFALRDGLTPGLLDLLLRICDGLSFGFLDLTPRRFRLLPGHFQLALGVLQLLLGLVRNLKPRLFQLLPGLFRNLLLGFGSLARCLLLQLTAEFLSLPRGLRFGPAARVVGLRAHLFRGDQLGGLRTRQIGV